MKNPIAVSSWSLHHNIGISFQNGPGHAPPFARHDTWGPGMIAVDGLPAALKLHGYTRLELCHFHVGDTSATALADLRSRFETAGVILQTLLIDDGDLTNPETAKRDEAWIAEWIHVGAALGAEHVRVIAGKAAPNKTTLATSIAALRRLVAVGRDAGISVVTENWFDLLSTPEAVHHILDHVDGLGFLADTGNWRGPTKYDALEAIFTRAILCHAKTQVANGIDVDDKDFSQCLQAASRAHYNGPMTLIFDDPGDEWTGLDALRRFIFKGRS
jgi:sugar phosphate isomerase/epimerase